jgi:putative ABC transport system permease protein
MRFFDCSRLAYGAVARSPARTLMMLLATAIGVSAVLVLTSLGEAARRFVTDEFQSLGTDLVIVIPGRTETTGMGPGLLAGETPRDLTLGDARAVLRARSVAKVAPVMVGSASASYNGLEREIPILGTTRAFMEIRRWHMSLGEFLPGTDMTRASPVCVIGRTTQQELFGKIPPIGKWLRVGDRRCRVSGVLGDLGRSVMMDTDDIVILPVVSAQTLFNSPGLFRIITQAAGHDSVQNAKNQILNIIKKRHYGEEDVTVVTQDAVLSTFEGIFRTLTLVLAGIATISLLVAGVLIMNVMLVAVSQRTAEIGLLKAIGARRRQIIALFLTEAIFLASLGGAVGIVLGYLAIGAMAVLYPAMNFSPPLWAVAGAFGIAMACGVFFGILPARRAAELDPIAALASR